MTAPTRPTYFCAREWHHGHEVAADFFLRAWTDTPAHQADPDHPAECWSTCSRHLGEAVTAVSERVGWPRPFIVLRDVRGL